MSTQASAVAAVPSVPANRRAAVRYPCGEGVDGEVSLAGDYVSRRAPIVDISTGGVALRLSRQLPRGTPLLLQLHHAELGLRYTIAMQVAHCTVLPGRKWIVGCAFARELSTQELQSLL